MRTTLVSIPTDTVPLDGAYYEPEGRAIAGAALLFHGNTMNFYQGAPRFLPPVLTGLGLACLAFNRRGHDILSTRDEPVAGGRRVPADARGDRRQPHRGRVARRTRVRTPGRHRTQQRRHARGASRRRSSADARARPALRASRRQGARPAREPDRSVRRRPAGGDHGRRRGSSWRPGAATSSCCCPVGGAS